MKRLLSLSLRLHRLGQFDGRCDLLLSGAMLSGRSSATPTGKSMVAVAGWDRAIEPVAVPATVKAVPNELPKFVLDRRNIPS